jgi:hypothetical protein
VPEEMKKREEVKLQKKKILAEISVKLVDRNENYFRTTFYDPILLSFEL